MPRATRQITPAERLCIDEMYRRKKAYRPINGYVTTAAPVPMVGKAGKSPWQDPERIVPPGTTLKIVMVSSMGDAGLTDDLNADSGYGVRLDWEDAAMTEIRLCP